MLDGQFFMAGQIITADEEQGIIVYASFLTGFRQEIRGTVKIYDVASEQRRLS